jgi:hypothetical protein
MHSASVPGIGQFIKATVFTQEFDRYERYRPASKPAPTMRFVQTLASKISPAARVNSTRLNLLRLMTFMGLGTCAIRNVLIVTH